MNDFKVRCVKSETACFTVGNIYKVKGNNIMGNNAVPVSIIGCSCIEDINRTIASQFELVAESKPVESVVTEDEHGTLHIQFQEKDNIPKLKSEPNYKELYEKAYSEIGELKEIIQSLEKENGELNNEQFVLTVQNNNMLSDLANSSRKIKRLKKCLKKQYKFIDKLIPERIEV